MAPIIRHAPGERVNIAGTYALVGHYGEVTGFSVECLKGETLPLVSVSTEYEWLWYVLVGVEAAMRRAA